MVSVMYKLATKGAFNNHVEKILTYFDPLPPQIDKPGHFSDPLLISMWMFNMPYLFKDQIF